MVQETTKNIAADFDELNTLPCNTIAHLQILTPTKAIRLKTNLIGIDPNMSVILAIRHDHDWSAAKNHIREGQGAIIRLLNFDSPEANIIAFRTSIQKIMSIVGNWLVLDYPKKELQKVSLRKSSRITIHIECNIVDKSSKKIVSSGVLHDISIHGCAFIGKILSKETVDSKYELQVKVDGQDTPLACPVTVINNAEKDNLETQQQFGLIFQKDDEKSKEFIQKIILSHLSASAMHNMSPNTD